MAIVLSFSDTDQTFGGMVERILADLGREGDEKTEAAVRVAIVRQLNSVRTEPYHFTEASGSLTMVTDISSYSRGTGDNNVPADLLFVDAVRMSGSGSSDEYVLERNGIEEMRQRQVSNVTSNRPRYYAWWAEQLIVFPTPSSSSDQLLIDYHKDSTLDSLGNVITVNSSLETNDWFSFQGGEALLSGMVVAEVAMRHLQDAGMAQFHAVIAAAERTKLQQRYSMQSLNKGRPKGWLL